MSIDSDLDSLPTEPGPTDADGVAGESIDAAVTSPDSLGRSGAPGERAEIGQPYVRPARLAGLVAFFGLLFLWRGLPVIVIVSAILVMIFLHELGHFVMARRAGMKVTEFMIGFGPRIWSFRRGEVEYGIKAIPAGAYVKILGMANIEEVAPEDESRTYRQKGYLARMGVAVAGSTMHFILALLLCTAALVTMGSVDETNWAVSSVAPSSAADISGVRPHDRIVAIDGVPVGTHDEMATEAKKRPGKTVAVTIVRNGHRRDLTATITPRFNFYGTIGEDVVAYGNERGGVSLSLGGGGAIELQGFRDGDQVVTADGVSISSVEDLRRVITARAAASSGEVHLAVRRTGFDSPINLTLNLGTAMAADPLVGFLGVGRELVPQPMGITHAVPQSFVWFGTVGWQSMKGLAHFFSPSSLGAFFERAISTRPGETHVSNRPETAVAAAHDTQQRDGNRVVSIVGAVVAGEKLAQNGWGNVLMFLAALNLVIGIFNLLPLPPFDGGHVAIGTYEKIRELVRRDGKRYLVDFNKVMPVATAVVVIMALVGVMAIYLDLADPIKV